MARRRNKKAVYLAQLAIIAIAAVMLILAVVLVLILGKDSIAPAPSSSRPLTSVADPTSSDFSSDLSSVITSLQQTTTSATGSNGGTTSYDIIDFQTNTPMDDPRQLSYAPGPDSADDGVKRVYLTFDDGPSSKVTPQILNVLDEYNVKATFFVIGTGDMSMVKETYSRGHAIALHTDCHEYEKVYDSPIEYFKDLTAIGNKVKAQIGFVPNIIRFPGGSSNTISRNHCRGIMSLLTEEVENKGYYYFDWNVDSWDASGNNVSVEKIMSKIKEQVYSGQENICVLMHDTNAKRTTAEALPQIIDYFRDAGYEFCVLNKHAAEFHHGVNN